METWTKFLSEQNQKRPIPKDVWNMVLDFAFTINEDMSILLHKGYGKDPSNYRSYCTISNYTVIKVI